VAREHLLKILEQEGTSFYKVYHRWQPKNLIPDPYRRNLLKDAQARFNSLSEAEEEMRGLKRGQLYLQILYRMRLTIRQAQFAWRTDDLKFLTKIADFFSDYGTVLQNLKIDQARGRLEQQ
jgi:hypothetical protein